MKNQKWIILSFALVLIAGTAAALVWLRANQKLGEPGIKATPVAGQSHSTSGGSQARLRYGRAMASGTINRAK